ncbi:MAG: NAD(P)/FAD-dependent oxidoreductase [Chloroflexi bacterium]|nr:NAD(P)/FAD-dependent oxidoreductase [Chloroflexota bacterium]
MTGAERVDVAIIGGGQAGACLASRLARRGIEVVVLERSLNWRWHAAGVFSSPAAMDALRRVGVSEEVLARVARPIPALRLETPGGATVGLTYGHDRGGPPAIGFDRSALDPALLELARAAGADVRLGTTVTSVQLGGGRAPAMLTLRTGTGTTTVHARVVIGADGPHSIVAREAGVARPARLATRVGLTHHLADPRADDEPVDGRMQILPDGYVGIAPVPSGRVNIGIVLGRSWRPRLAREGAARVAASIEGTIPATPHDVAPWRGAATCDPIAGASPLGGRVTRRAGLGWFLVGDAAGFLDPFTGEGIHRALVSTELAAAAIRAALTGRSTAAAAADAAGAYDRAMRRRFATKDAVTWLVQAFLARPVLFEYVARRLATRGDARATMGLVMGDLIPASRALDPRLLAAVLAP